MRNPKRIYMILELVAKIWTLCPDLRLGQLILNAIEEAGFNGDPFYCEDDRLVAGLERTLERIRAAAPERREGER